MSSREHGERAPGDRQNLRMRIRALRIRNDLKVLVTDLTGKNRHDKSNPHFAKTDHRDDAGHVSEGKGMVVRLCQPCSGL